MLRMQQHMRLMGHRLSKEIAVDLPDIRVLMRVADISFCVQRIELSASRKRQLLTVVDRLSAATCTSARACHDLYEIVFHFALLQSSQQFSRVAQSADNRHLDCNAFDFKDGFFPALNASYLLKGVRLRVLARQQEVSRTQRCLHNTAGRTEYDAGSGRFAKEIIKEAGAFIKESLSKTITVEEKTAFDDLVTNIDKQTQDLLVARIKSAFPSDNIFAEENGLVHNIKDGNVWVLDPIDGTVNFIVQQDNFCVMIAYYEEGQGKFGLIYNVMADQLFYGGGQFDVYCNDKLLPAYKNRPLDRCLVASNGAMYAKNFHGLKDLIDKTLGVRVYGGAGLSMSKVLSGQILAYCSVIYPWDYAASSIMGEKLSYHLETITGEPLDYFSRQAVMLVPKDRLEEIKDIMGSEN